MEYTEAVEQWVNEILAAEVQVSKAYAKHLIYEVVEDDFRHADAWAGLLAMLDIDSREERIRHLQAAVRSDRMNAVAKSALARLEQDSPPAH